MNILKNPIFNYLKVVTLLVMDLHQKRKSQLHRNTDDY